VCKVSICATFFHPLCIFALLPKVSFHYAGDTVSTFVKIRNRLLHSFFVLITKFPATSDRKQAWPTKFMSMLSPWIFIIVVANETIRRKKTSHDCLFRLRAFLKSTSEIGIDHILIRVATIGGKTSEPKIGVFCA